MNPDLTPELTGAQFEAKFAQVKNLKSMSNQPKPPLRNKPGTHRQVSAELDRLKAENMTLKAKIAATSKPALAKPAAPSALSPRDQRRAAAKGTISDQSDSQLQFVAGHRSATEADRSAARAELQARGWTIHPSGSFSQSIRKAPRR